MPDITLLPALSGAFGVTIDDLFDLTVEQKLQRIEQRMDHEFELPGDLFLEYEEFLSQELSEYSDQRRILSLPGHLYHHRMESDARKVSRYAREAMRLAPEIKDCQWLLQRSESQAAWDWNVANHRKVIDFYRALIENDPVQPGTPLPCYCLIDNLIADHRTAEAQSALEACASPPAFRPFMREVYEAHIAQAEYDEQRADAILEGAIAKYAAEGNFLFEAAQYYARKCNYARAIECCEASYACDAQRRPRYSDALHAIAAIHEITGDYQKAASTFDRILENLRSEWGLTDETAVQEALQERDRLLKRAGPAPSDGRQACPPGRRPAKSSPQVNLAHVALCAAMP